MQDKIVIGGSISLKECIGGDLDLTEQIDGQIGSFTNIGFREHDRLTHRDYADQHPMSAITGLTELLARTPRMTSNTSENWATRTDYVPQAGEIIVYTDYSEVDGEPVPNIKIGDGTTYVVDLPFVGDDLRAQFVAHSTNEVIHITQAEREFWNAKLNYDDVVNENLMLTRS